MMNNAIEFKRNDKLINVVYTDGNYHLFEPQNTGQNKFNIIDNHLWLACKFMPDVRYAVISLLEINRSERRRCD